jgi:hypothetical protein
MPPRRSLHIARQTVQLGMGLSNAAMPGPGIAVLPSSAAAAFTTVAPAGVSVLGAWVTLALGASVAAITRRDV